MTKTDFAELKEKLTEIDDKYNDIIIHGYTHVDGSKGLPPYNVVAEHQFNKDAAIISELIEILQIQSEALEEIYSFEKHCPDTHYYTILNKSLSETTTRLQKLREGNNGNKTN